MEFNIFLKVNQRLKNVKSEFDGLQKLLADLDTKQTSMINTFLLTGEAIQVREEELAKSNEDDAQPLQQSDLKSVRIAG